MRRLTLPILISLFLATEGFPSGFPPINSVAIAGELEAPIKIDEDWLASHHGLERVTVKRSVTSSSGEAKTEEFTGYLLKDILRLAKPRQKDRHDWKKMIVVATAFDNYTVLFSYSELVNTPVGNHVIVYFEKDGVPIDLDSDGFGLISASDTRTGPRHVKVLTEITLTKAIL